MVEEGSSLILSELFFFSEFLQSAEIAIFYLILRPSSHVFLQGSPVGAVDVEELNQFHVFLDGPLVLAEAGFEEVEVMLFYLFGISL